jgi:hypothetical protein
MGREDVDWIFLAQGRDKWRAVVNTVMNRAGFITCGEFLDCPGDYFSRFRRTPLHGLGSIVTIKNGTARRKTYLMRFFFNDAAAADFIYIASR